jgi:hypothetical protein
VFHCVWGCRYRFRVAFDIRVQAVYLFDSGLAEFEQSSLGFYSDCVEIFAVGLAVDQSCLFLFPALQQIFGCVKFTTFKLWL